MQSILLNLFHATSWLINNATQIENLVTISDI